MFGFFFLKNWLRFEEIYATVDSTDGFLGSDVCCLELCRKNSNAKDSEVRQRK